MSSIFEIYSVVCTFAFAFQSIAIDSKKTMVDRDIKRLGSMAMGLSIFGIGIIGAALMMPNI